MKEHFGPVYRQSYLIQHVHFKRLFEDDCLEFNMHALRLDPWATHKSLLRRVYFVVYVFNVSVNPVRVFLGRFTQGPILEWMAWILSLDCTLESSGEL